MALPVITQTVSGQVTIVCSGSRNTYITSSIEGLRNRVGSLKGNSADTAARGDTVAPYPAYSPSSTVVTTAGARPLVGLRERRIGDSNTTISVVPGSGIQVLGYGPNGALTHSNSGQWYIVW